MLNAKSFTSFIFAFVLLPRVILNVIENSNMAWSLDGEINVKYFLSNWNHSETQIMFKSRRKFATALNNI